MNDDFLWVEKYRPKTVEQTILQSQLKDTFAKIVESGEIPNMLFTGTAGLGKTTVAKAICEQLQLDYIVINGSEEGNIDTLRGKIKQFASSISLQGGYKVVILDEADYLNPQSTQPALRGFIEEFSKNCGFILTCNFKNRIIDPLQSRCSIVEFKIDNKEKPNLAATLFKRVLSILDENNVEYNKKVVAELIQKSFPDYRRVLNTLQQASTTGAIDTGTLTSTTDDLTHLVGYLKNKEFTEMRKWVAENSDVDVNVLFRKFYDQAYQHLKPESIPQLVVHLADYQYKSAFAVDQEINLVALLTHVMMDCDFK